jgi:predicted dehydrogenase
MQVAIGRRSADEDEDVSMALVEFENGARASVVSSVVSPREETYLRFDFQRATVELRHPYSYTDADWRFTPRPGEDEALAETWRRFPKTLPSTHASQLREVVASIRAGRRPPTGPREVRPTMEFITAVYRSAMTRRPVLRESLSADDAFYRALHGNVPEWAPRR